MGQAVNSFLTGGQQQPQQQSSTSDLSNMIDPNSILNDSLAYDPTYSAQQTIPSGQTSAPGSVGAGDQSGGTTDTSGASAANLGSLRDLFMTTQGAQAGTPGIQRTPPAPGQQTAPSWFMDNRFGNWQTMRNAAQSPTGTPVTAPGPDVPIPQPRPPAAAIDDRFGVMQPPAAAPTPPPAASTGILPPDVAGGGMPELQTPALAPLTALPPPTPPAEAAVGPVQAGATAPTHEPSADIPMESGVSGADRQQPQPTVTNVPVKPAPSQQEQPEQPQAAPQQQPQQFNPQRLLEDFLFGGPQALMQDLEGLLGQFMRGGGQMPQWAPGFGPKTGRYQATPQEIQQFRRNRQVPSATISPQSSKISGEEKPKRVTPTRETPAPTPVNLPATAGAKLDPITAGTTTGGTPAAAPAAGGDAAARADWGGNYNIANRAIPAPIRFNNPGGAQAWAGSAKWGGQGNYNLVPHPGTGEMDKISHYPTPVHGAASNLDEITSSPTYRGRRLGDAMRTWSGNMRVTTGDRSLDNLPANRETFANPEVAIKFMTAMQKAEAGRVWMTRPQMLSAWQMWRAGSAQAYEDGLGKSTVGAAQPQAFAPPRPPTAEAAEDEPGWAHPYSGFRSAGQDIEDRRDEPPIDFNPWKPQVRSYPSPEPPQLQRYDNPMSQQLGFGDVKGYADRERNRNMEAILRSLLGEQPTGVTR